MSVEAMRQALEALENTYALRDDVIAAKESLRQAIAVYESTPPECQTEAEKTAYAFGWWKAMETKRAVSETHKWVNATTWRGLTDEEIKRIGKLDWDDNYVGLWYDFAKALEAKLKAKNFA